MSKNLDMIRNDKQVLGYKSYRSLRLLCPDVLTFTQTSLNEYDEKKMNFIDCTYYRLSHFFSLRWIIYSQRFFQNKTESSFIR